MVAMFTALLDSREEKEQFLAVYHRHKRMVYHTALGVLHDPALAEDVLQEVFLYVAENFSRLPTDDCHKMARYLVISGRARAVTMLRRRQREIPAEFDDDALGEDGGPLPDDLTVSSDQAARLLRLVAELKPIYRDPLELLIQGMSYRQIAESLNLAEATVRQRVARARKILWKELQQDEEDD